MKKSFIFVCFLSFSSMVYSESYFSTITDPIEDLYTSISNYLGHSTSTTKLDRALSILRGTYCSTPDFLKRTNCGQLKQFYINKYPQTNNEQLKHIVKQQQSEVAYVRSSHELCQEEDAFRANRIAHIARSLESVYGIQNDVNIHVPTIGICASGGGWRAMIATGGFYDALEEKQNNSDVSTILDTIMYASCLSGSTWYTVPRSLGIPAQALKEGYKKYGLIPVSLSLETVQKLKGNPLVVPQSGMYPETFNYTGTTYEKNYFDERETLYDNLMRSFLSQMPLSAVSLYGQMIAHMVLSPFDDPEIYKKYGENTYQKQARQQILFSQSKYFLESKNCSQFPLPLATMVSPIGTRSAKKQKVANPYIWAEVTPYETGFDYYTSSGFLNGSYIPTWATGRRFGQLSSSGKNQSGIFSFFKRNETTRYGSIDNNPEPTLGTFLGIFGSAFAFSSKDIGRLMFNIDPNAGGIKGLVAQIVDLINKVPTVPLTPWGLLIPGQQSRLLPSELPNYAVVPDSPFYGQDYWTVVDAGIASNLPFWPLLRKHREVDIIIAFNAGADASRKANALIEAEKLAKLRNVPFPKIADSSKFANCTKQQVTVFDEYDEGNSGPIVIYCTLMGEWIDECLKGECTTFNFEYSPETVDTLWALGKQIGQAAVPEIKKAVERATQGKTKGVLHSYVGRQWLKLKRTMFSYMPKLRIDRVKA